MNRQQRKLDREFCICFKQQQPRKKKKVSYQCLKGKLMFLQLKVWLRIRVLL